MTKLKTCQSVGDAETRSKSKNIKKSTIFKKKKQKWKAPKRTGTDGLCMQRNGELQRGENANAQKGEQGRMNREKIQKEIKSCDNN
jgi:hypothetical protein